MRTQYRFGREWELQASPSDVHRLLIDVAGYPQWWPGVRLVADVSSATRRAARLDVRAPMRYTLRLTITESVVRDDELCALLSGDLDGWCMWRIEPTRGGTRVQFSEEVEVRRRLLRVLSPVLHNRLAAQHDAVVRDAERGMRAVFGKASAE